jgi:hypothetical protein
LSFTGLNLKKLPGCENKKPSPVESAVVKRDAGEGLLQVRF